MYAFAILAWELFSQKRPFADIKNEGELCTKVHRGNRPPLSDLPKDTPQVVINMIDSCWNRDRNLRRTAVECVSILQYEYLINIKSNFDIYFSHAAVPKLLLSHIFHYFIRLGFSVCSGQGCGSNGGDGQHSTDLIKSKIVIVCFDKEYQQSTQCMKDLEVLRETCPEKMILTLVVEEKLMGWANERAKEVCALSSEYMVDIGHIGRAQWDSEEGPDASMLVALTKNLEPLKDLVVKAGCSSDIRASTLQGI